MIYKGDILKKNEEMYPWVLIGFTIDCIDVQYGQLAKYKHSIKTISVALMQNIPFFAVDAFRQHP